MQNYILVLLVVLTIGCQRPEAPPAGPPPAEVTVAKPLVLPIIEWDEFVGRLDAIETVEIRSRVSGYLQSTHFNEGQLVAAGDLLAIIDPRPFIAAQNAAKAKLLEQTAKVAEANAFRKQAIAEKADSQAQLTLADQRMERSRQLARQNATPQEEVDVRESEKLQAAAAVEAANAKVESANAAIATANAAVETAKADVETADLNLQYTQIRSPIAGRISRRYITEGNLISGGFEQSTLLTTIVSTDPIHCYFDADERLFLKYGRLSREGKRESSRDAKNPVYMRLVNEQGFPHVGHMDFVDNRIDPNTGTMRGRAIFPNDDNTLTPGLFAEVRLPGSGRYEAVLIPDSAISSDQSEKFVYLVAGDGSVTRQAVELGPIVKGLRVIRSGLSGSETFITRGLQRIIPGATVVPIEETFEAKSDNDLPDNYVPVPPEKWLSRRPAPPPAGLIDQASRATSVEAAAP